MQGSIGRREGYRSVEARLNLSAAEAKERFAVARLTNQDLTVTTMIVIGEEASAGESPALGDHHKRANDMAEGRRLWGGGLVTSSA